MDTPLRSFPVFLLTMFLVLLPVAQSAADTEFFHQGQSCSLGTVFGQEIVFLGTALNTIAVFEGRSAGRICMPSMKTQPGSPP